MIQITSACVSFRPTVSDSAHTLEYLGNLYQQEATFLLGQKTEAENHWCHLTDNSSNIYLLLTEPQVYSLWVLIAQSNKNSKNSVLTPTRGKAIPNLAIHLLQSLWLVITDLGGVERARTFERDVIASDLPIDSEANLQACLLATPPAIDCTELDRGRQIINRFEQLARLQVGATTVSDVIDRLPIAEKMSASRLF
jgi:hypothetical protein